MKQPKGLCDLDICNHLSVDDYQHLRKAVGWAPLPEEQAARGLQNTAYIVTAMDGKQVVGSARMLTDQGYIVYIADVMVLPSYQGKGIGKALIEHLLAHLRQTLRPGEKTMVSLMAASGKEAFYESFGFLRRPTDTLGAGMSQWIEKP